MSTKLLAKPTVLADYLETYRKNPACDAGFIACNASKLQHSSRRFQDFAQNLKVLVQIENSRDTETTNEWAAEISHQLTDILMLERCQELAGLNPIEVRCRETFRHDDPRHRQPIAAELLSANALETVLRGTIAREIPEASQRKKALGHLERLLPIITRKTPQYRHASKLKVASFYLSHVTAIRS